MNMLFRNFFYAVGFTGLLFLYQADPNTVTFGDLVRLVQSTTALQLVLVITAILFGLEFTSRVSRRAGASSSELIGTHAMSAKAINATLTGK